MTQSKEQSQNSVPRHALNVVRRGLIGVAEIVPGVSGGTVALVVGIFEDLIGAAGHVVTSARLLVSGDRGPAGLGFRYAKWHVVVPALIANVAALLVGVKVVEP